MKLRSWFRHQTRKRVKVFIIPTKMGGYLNGLIFLMMLLSIGYSNNLLLIFTLLLFGFNLMWVVQTHFHLHSLKLDYVMVPHGFANSKVHMSVHWKSFPKSGQQWLVELESESEIRSVKLMEESPEKIVGEISPPLSWTLEMAVHPGGHRATFRSLLRVDLLSR